MYGAKIFNLRNKCQVNSDYPVMHRVESGSWTRPYDSGEPTNEDDRTEVTFTTPILFTACPIVGIRPHSNREPYTNWRANVSGYVPDGDYCDGFNIAWSRIGKSATYVDEVDWCLFAKTVNADAVDDYGIYAYDSSGNLTWNSNNQPMRVWRCMRSLSRTQESAGIWDNPHKDVTTHYFIFYPPYQDTESSGFFRTYISCDLDWNILYTLQAVEFHVAMGSGSDVWPTILEVS